MSKLVVVAEVQDLTAWETAFRTHGDLFRSQTISKPIHFGTAPGNMVAVCFEPDDMAACLKVMESPATAAAMAFDGVKRETVKMFVLDTTFEL